MTKKEWKFIWKMARIGIKLKGIRYIYEHHSTHRKS